MCLHITYFVMLMRDFSSFDIMLLNFIQHCTIIMPAEFSIKIITHNIFIVHFLHEHLSLANTICRNYAHKIVCKNDTERTCDK